MLHVLENKLYIDIFKPFIGLVEAIIYYEAQGLCVMHNLHIWFLQPLSIRIQKKKEILCLFAV